MYIVYVHVQDLRNVIKVIAIAMMSHQSVLSLVTIHLDYGVVNFKTYIYRRSKYGGSSPVVKIAIAMLFTSRCGDQ